MPQPGKQLIFRSAAGSGQRQQIESDLDGVAFGKIGGIGNIEGSEVHRHSPDLRTGNAADPCPPLPRSAARVAIGIAQRHHGKSRAPARDKCGPIADRLPCGDIAQLNDRRHQPRHRLQSRKARRGAPAIKPDSRPGQIEMIAGAKADTRRIGEGIAAGSDTGSKRGEGGALDLVLLMIRFLGAGKVAVQRIDDKAVEQSRNGLGSG